MHLLSITPWNLLEEGSSKLTPKNNHERPEIFNFKRKARKHHQAENKKFLKDLGLSIPALDIPISVELSKLSSKDCPHEFPNFILWLGKGLPHSSKRFLLVLSNAIIFRVKFCSADASLVKDLREHGDLFGTNFHKLWPPRS